jgi:hypothetical protein
MSKNPPDPIDPSRGAARPSLTSRLETVRYLTEIKSSRRRKIPIQNVAEALIEAGYTSLDSKAKALGLHRATAWTIIKMKHKLGRLNTKTVERILANPNTPPSVRAIIQQALAEH